MSRVKSEPLIWPVGYTCQHANTPARNFKISYQLKYIYIYIYKKKDKKTLYTEYKMISEIIN